MNETQEINRLQNQAKKNLKKQIFLASEHQTTDLHSTLQAIHF